MNCPACHHRWCWVCGLPLKHWSHKFSDFLPLSCKTVPKTYFGWIGYFLMFLLGYVAIPLFIFLVANFAVLFCFFEKICRQRSLKTAFRYGSICKKILMLMFLIPLYILISVPALAIGIPFAAFCLVILLLPAYAFHTFYFIRTCYWWNKTRTRTLT